MSMKKRRHIGRAKPAARRDNGDTSTRQFTLVALRRDRCGWLELCLWRRHVSRRYAVRAKLVADKLVINTPGIHTACGKYERFATMGTAQGLTGHSSPPKRNRHSRHQCTIAFEVPRQQVQRIGNAHHKCTFLNAAPD